MIELFYWPTPNGHKITIFLEEAKMPYKIVSVDISQGEQFSPQFLKISPNNRIPAIIDHAPDGGENPIAIFESGAILIYLAKKAQQFFPQALREQYETLEWLFWQVSGLGPMAGQNHHFSVYATEKIPYAIERYVKETARLYGVLNKRLENRKFIVNDYTITDMACYPWIASHEKQQQNLDDFPNIKRWYLEIQKRPAVQRAYALSNEINL